MGCAPSSAITTLEARLSVTEDRLKELEKKFEQQQLGGSAQENGASSIPATHSKPRPSSSSSQSRRIASGETPLASAAAIHPILISPAPKPLPTPQHMPSQEEKIARRIEFDVFLSHKRTDCADFARTLKTELTDIAGLTCFLDQDADFELGDLMSKVRGSATFIFILSEHILESEWCLLELREALLWGCNVILLTAHGAKWIVDGHTHDFPPAKIIRPEIAPAFANKAIEYNRNFHKASMDQLLQRMYGRPVHAGLTKWELPVRSYEEPANFLIDLATVGKQDQLHLSLPPENPLSALHGLCRWSAPGDEFLVCGLSTPFHVTDGEPAGAGGASSSPNSRRYLLEAQLARPWSKEPSRLFPATSWNALVLDALPSSVQTGLWKLDTEERSSIIMKAGSSVHSFHITFPQPFRSSTPEIFVCLTRFNSYGRFEKGETDRTNATWRIFSLRALHSENTGFTLSVEAKVPASQRFREQTHYEIDELSAAWLAYDCKLNRSMVHGVLWVVNEENHRREVTQVIHFASDGVGGSSKSRNAFASPPLVFLSLGGCDSDTVGWSMEFSVSDVTTTQAKITWHMHHRYTVPAQEVFKGFNTSTSRPLADTAKFGPKALGASSQPPQPRPPCSIAIHWLAIPANKDIAGQVGAPHAAAATAIEQPNAASSSNEEKASE